MSVAWLLLPSLCCPELSHNRKTLLKFLLRNIALSSYAPHRQHDSHAATG
jgi:hypothetical protein